METRASSGTSIGYTEDEVPLYNAIVQKLPERNENISLNTNTNGVNLLALNDYCLEIILQHLDLQHQIRLSLCHPRLKQIFAYMVCPRLPRHLDLQDICNFSRWELQQYFEIFRIHLESILIGTKCSSENAASIFSSIKEYDLHVKRVYFILHEKLQYRNLFDVLNYDYVTELELYYCGLFDFDLEHLRNLRNLETLGLAGNSYIQVTPLKYLRKLRRLSLFGCRGITCERLNECNRYLQLRYLDIRTPGLNFNPKYCETLETLKVSEIDDSNAESILKLPNLKSLEVQNLHTEMTQFWKSLAGNCTDLFELKLTDTIYEYELAEDIYRLLKLHTLWLCGNVLTVTEDFLKLLSNLTDLEEISLKGCIRLRDEHLVSLIRNCTKLKRLNLRGCREITNDSILSLLNILQNRPEIIEKEKEASQPLVILVYGTRIHRNILQDPVYKQRQNLLKLLFHNQKPLMGLTIDRSAFDIKDTETNCLDVSDDYSDVDDDDYYSYYDDYDRPWNSSDSDFY